MKDPLGYGRYDSPNKRSSILDRYRKK
jgi:hypothetical protein